MLTQAKEKKPITMSIRYHARLAADVAERRTLRLVTDVPVPMPSPGEILTRIGDSTAPNGLFDFGRIEIERNRL